MAPDLALAMAAEFFLRHNGGFVVPILDHAISTADDLPLRCSAGRFILLSGCGTHLLALSAHAHMPLRAGAGR